MWCGTAGDKQVSDLLRTITRAQSPGKLKRNSRSEAMPQQRHRPIQPGQQLFSHAVDQLRDAPDKWLTQPAFTSGELHCAHLNIPWKPVWPCAKGARRSTGMGKTQQAQSRPACIQAAVWKPALDYIILIRNLSCCTHAQLPN